MIEIEVSREHTLVMIEDKEYYYPAEQVYIVHTANGRIQIREVADEPLAEGELLWDLPNYTIIHYIP